MKKSNSGSQNLPRRDRVSLVVVVVRTVLVPLALLCFLASFRGWALITGVSEAERPIRPQDNATATTTTTTANHVRKPLETERDGDIVTQAHGSEYSAFWHYRDRTEFESSVALKNICYSLDQGQFVLAKADDEAVRKGIAAQRSSNGSAMMYAQRLDERIRQSQVRQWIRGHTVVSLSMSLEGAKGAHFYFWVEPMFAAMSVALRILKIEPSKVHIAYKKYPKPSSFPAVERGVWDLLFGELPAENHISLDSIEPEDGRRYVCMSNALVVERSYTSTLRSSDDLAHVRDNIRRRTELPVVDDCADGSANRHTVFLLSRRTFSRKFSNEDEIVSGIKRVFGPQVEVVVFESPNQRCTPGWEKRSELSFCNFVPEKVQSEAHKEHLFFNNATFLVSVHGAGNMNYVYLPQGAHAVEIMPVGVHYGMYGQLARRVGIEYFEFKETNRSLYDQSVRVANPAACPGDNDCRRISKELSVHVTMEGDGGLVEVLKKARASWQQRCHGLSR